MGHRSETAFTISAVLSVEPSSTTIISAFQALSRLFVEGGDYDAEVNFHGMQKPTKRFLTYHIRYLRGQKRFWDGEIDFDFVSPKNFPYLLE
jgi:hypothetical protein